MYHLDMFVELYNYFFLVLTTLTVVGYGAGSHMPQYNTDSDDTLLLTLIILFGVMTFSKYASELQLQFKYILAQKSIYTQLVLNDEKIENYFMQHNQIWNVK